MRKKVLIMFTALIAGVVAVLLSPVGPFHHGTQESPVVIGRAANGTTVTVQPGQPVRLLLASDVWNTLQMPPRMTRETTTEWSRFTSSDTTVLAPTGPAVYKLTPLILEGHYAGKSEQDYTAGAAGSTVLTASAATRMACGSLRECYSFVILDRFKVTVQVN